MNQYVPFIVLSAFKRDLVTDKNEWRNLMLARDLKLEHFDISPTTGTYNGFNEKGYLVVVSDEDRFNRLLAIARKYGQTAVLWHTSTGEVHMVYLEPDGHYSVYYGHWREYSALTDREQDFTEVHGQKYVAIGP